ncbi:MAG: bifunctional riboflavin kinase/FMN adenylyltransferase, partial [Verrucomicrobiae bacterium]|nr:bifunctional riboflavin kinase/FMN adenylyltransferase [Verrucomicrobiae bacterium]
SVLRGTNAHAFLTELRSVCPNLRAVIVGHQWHFGCDRDGNFSVLSRFAAERGFEAVEVPPVRHEGEIISSTRIRALVGEGRMEEAARLLGRPYSIRARVVPGSGIGRMLGFPTANLQVENELLPAPGVYACRVRSEGESHAAALNCGHRPTLPGQATASLTVEAHLIDFRGDLKDARVEVDFGTRLRDERKFAGAEELRAQIARDVAGVRASWSAFQGR